MQTTKLRVFSLEVPLGTLRHLFQVEMSQVSSAGLVLCGQPLPKLAADVSHEDVMSEAAAVGTLACQLVFLSQCTARVRRQCMALETIAKVIPDWGVHLAVDCYVAVFLLARCTC